MGHSSAAAEVEGDAAGRSDQARQAALERARARSGWQVAFRHASTELRYRGGSHRHLDGDTAAPIAREQHRNHDI
jgi:hypothetical protein